MPMFEGGAKRRRDWGIGDMIGLLLVIFVDGLGTAIVLPLLPTLLSPNAPASLVAGAEYTSDALTFLYSIILASYAAAMMFGAPMLG